MPKLHNVTPYPNFRYYSRNNNDDEFGIVMVKATYELAPSGRLLAAEEQAPLVFTDLCHGDVNVTSLWHPSDLVPNKPATDVIVNAVARSSDGVARPSWGCGVKITDHKGTRAEKILRVTGPRDWMPKWKRALGADEARNWKEHRKLFDRWELSEPSPIIELPLHYEYAYGGEISAGMRDDGTPAYETDNHNPIGKGKISRDWSNHTLAVPAPQIEDIHDPISDPLKQYTPQSFGPIPPGWLPRRPLGGTYDQHWMDSVWPKWPADYDFAYHNSAHPDLIVKPYLNGGERITLVGLTTGVSHVEFNLPSEKLFVKFVREDGPVDPVAMNLDTVFLDIAAPTRRDWRVYLSWRVNFEPNVYEFAEIYHDLAAPLTVPQ
ncbi:DUF2169 domain-containing protein [Phyllobacterium sp. TAF24]|uniref:DUF2169 family type VI secretion system accessory protein n=1 Tax=Phyllobacterium sp. TAF24 TaxID=3233068 RepID=UPI003F979B73